MTASTDFLQQASTSHEIVLGRLGDHVEILSGFSFDSSKFTNNAGMPLIRIRDVLRGRTETYYSGPFEQRFVVEEGDLLVGMDGDFNRETWSSGPALLNQRVCRISPSKATLDGRYLYHFLPRALMEIWQSTSFATVKHLSVKAIREIAVPLPPLEEQQRIGAILDKADEIRRKRRQALTALTELERSIFRDMFGPSVSRLGWKSAELGSVARFFGGSSLPNGEEYRGQEGGFALLKVSDMNRVGNEVRLYSSNLWSERAGSKAATCPENTIVIPKRGAAIATNKKRITTKPSVLDPNLMGIEPGAALDIEYLYAWFNGFDLATITSGSSVPQLNKQDLAPLIIDVPPMSLQEAFAQSARGVERLRHHYRMQLAELDALFASLQDRAFSGNL